MNETILLIIGGTTKAGTTSIFRYLSDHPSICGSSIKEPRFFIDEDYPVPVLYRYGYHDIKKYFEYFNHRTTENILLDGTPDYLYSCSSPEKIKEVFPGKVMWVFLLRNPIKRLTSWYRFAKQVGQISPEISFSDYVQIQLNSDRKKIENIQALRALEQGRYSKYLRHYINIVGRKNIRVICFEDFVDKPIDVLGDICDFIGVDAKYFQDYKVSIFNETKSFKNTGLQVAYQRYSDFLYLKIHNRTRLRSALRSIQDILIAPILSLVNEKENNSVSIAPHIRDLLDDYYRSEPTELMNLLDWKMINW